MLRMLPHLARAQVGDEILFRPSSGQVIEGIVVDVGWYRTTIRSFEREIFCIPNAAFSRNVVLNVTRKGKEWRFFEFIGAHCILYYALLFMCRCVFYDDSSTAGLRVEDIKPVSAVVADMRKIIRQDPRIIQKLHRRVFLDKITREQVTIYVSFYVEAANRDAFMAIKQDLFLAFVDCVERNGAKLAKQRVQVRTVFSVYYASTCFTVSYVSICATHQHHRTAGVCAQRPSDLAGRHPRRQQAGPASARGRCSHWGSPGTPAWVKWQRARGACQRDPRKPTGRRRQRGSGVCGGERGGGCDQGGGQGKASRCQGGRAQGGKRGVWGLCMRLQRLDHARQGQLRNMVTNASNLSSVAAAAAAVALTPDDILSSHQDGVMVTGSWDEI